MNIFVGSLPFSIDDADLRESFEAYGTVNSVKIITDKFTGRSKGFGFVELSSVILVPLPPDKITNFI
jgi:RNA recognition motif-containing protein